MRSCNSKHDLSQKTLCIIVGKNLLKCRFDIFWKEQRKVHLMKIPHPDTGTIVNANSYEERFYAIHEKGEKVFIADRFTLSYQSILYSLTISSSPFIL